MPSQPLEEISPGRAGSQKGQSVTTCTVCCSLQCCANNQILSCVSSIIFLKADNYFLNKRTAPGVGDKELGSNPDCVDEVTGV